ncbi:MAG: EAL domain-containing protein (putative c-di-GMP-specific phosphodiesterase class I) [Maricaulis maris]|jgi:EAL domain-containing protein (putative c-di-GMP-specific phosphodiesterase class I)
MLMSLVEQRNRFLSFAFASADILVETDSKGCVTYAAGAIATLGEPQLSGSGEDLAKRFDRTSRPIFQAIMHRLKPGRRLGPVRIAISGRQCRLSGWMLGDDDRIRWSLSYEAFDAPDELDPQAFERSAEQAIEKARSAGVDMAMSVLRVDAGDALDRLVGEARAAAIYQSIAASCALAVGDEGVARQVDEERTALIHDRTVDLNKLRAEIEASLADSGLDSVEVSIDSVCDAPNLEPGVAVQAFVYAMNEAAQSDRVLDVASLQKVAETMMHENERRLTELRTTIAGRVIEPHAQPVVNLETGETHHYELLLRLPDGKPVQDSVGFAESTGLIYEIDYAMTEIAAAFLRDDFDRPALAVNLSGKSLTNMAWGKRFLALLADLKIDRKRLSFELTETATITNIKAANAIIQKIRERGHEVCLDDFGAGAAGFHYLRDFPADVVKIDGSYIKRFETSKRDATLLKGMINVCRSLGAKTVAEMIETEAQAKALKAMGATFGQGYYFGKPAPLNSLKDRKKQASRAA